VAALGGCTAYHNYRIKDEDFVAAWQQSDSLKEVTAKTGIPTSNCQVRATRLREEGVDLPKLSRRSDEEKRQKP
jgi:hypothetical protein